MTHNKLFMVILTLIHWTTTPMLMDLKDHWTNLPTDICLHIVTTAVKSEKPWQSFKEASQLAQVSKTWNSFLNPQDLCCLLNIPPMHYAAIKNDVNEIIKLKLEEHSPLAPDQNNFTPIYYAAAYNQTNALMALKIGTLLDSEELKFIKGYIPTMTQEVLTILENEDSEQYSVRDLNAAIQKKDSIDILKILSSGVINAEEITLDNQDISQEVLNLLQYFIQCEIESSFFDQLQEDENPTQETRKLFKKFNANPNAYDSTGSALIYYAASSDKLLSTLRFLLRRKKTNIDQLHLFNKKNALQISIQENALSCMRYLISKNINCYHTCQKGNTILHCAALAGNLECLQELLEGYIHLINSKNKLGYTPLISAIQKEHIPCMLFLIQKKADLNIQSKSGNTALHYAVAASEPNVELIELLLQAKPNINCVCNKNFDRTNLAKNDGEYTPLHYAAQNGKAKCVKLLLKYGADKNLTTQLGKTALALAQEQRGKNPLDFERTLNNLKIIKLLSQ